MALDDDVPAIPLRFTGSGGRAITPSRIQISKRYGTPQRSTSAPRVSPLGNNRVRAQSSRRKQRRWENDHLFGTQEFRQIRGVSFDDEDESDHTALIIPEWRSAFHDIMKQPEALNEFLKGLTLPENRKSFSAQKSHQNPRIGGFSKPIVKPSDAWNRVEKRLRDIVERVIKTDNLKTFLISIEEVLVTYLKTGEAPLEINVPEAVRIALLNPIQLDASDLIISFNNSSFHRLLTHAMAQFHGLTSKTVSSEDNRVMQISRKAMTSEHCDFTEYDLSMIKFLSLRQRNFSNGIRRQNFSVHDNSGSSLQRATDMTGLPIHTKLQQLRSLTVADVAERLRGTSLSTDVEMASRQTKEVEGESEREDGGFVIIEDEDVPTATS